MNFSDVELWCELRRLYEDMQKLPRLDEETLDPLRMRFRILADFLTSTRDLDRGPNFLPLLQARLQQLEQLVHVAKEASRVRPLGRLPQASETDEWSLPELQRAVQFARTQANLLQRVPAELVPPEPLVELRSQTAIAVSNAARLQTLLGEVQQYRERDRPSIGAPVEGLTLLSILEQVRSLGMPPPRGWSPYAQNAGSQGFLRGRSTMVFFDHKVALVDEADEKLVAQLVGTADSAARKAAVERLRPIAFQGDPYFSDYTIQQELTAYSTDFFALPLTWERARLFVAVLRILFEYSQTLVADFSDVWLEATKGDPAEQQRWQSWASTIGSGVAGLVIGNVFGAGWALSAAGQAAFGIGQLWEYAGPFLQGKLIGAGAGLAFQPLWTRLQKWREGAPEEKEEDKPKYLTFNYNSIAERNKTISEFWKTKKAPGGLGQWDPAITPETVMALAFSWLFLPLELQRALETVEAMFSDKPDEGAMRSALASLFVPYTTLHTFAVTRKWTYFTTKMPQSIQANTQLIRHWLAKSADHAIEHVKAHGFPTEAGDEFAFAVSVDLSARGSDYGFAETIRRHTRALESVARVPDENLEVLLLDALRRASGDLPDLQAQFDMSKQAFLAYPIWGSVSPPPTAHFQARPYDLLRLRGLDLSGVSELQDVARGVRVMFPAEVAPSASPQALAEELLKPYLFAAWRKSQVFRNVWQETVNLYIAHTPARLRLYATQAPTSVPDIFFDF